MNFLRFLLDKVRDTSMNFEQIASDLQSDQQPVRAKAMYELLAKATHDPGIHPAALPLFRHCVQSEQDPWITAIAARGVEKIVGDVEARKTWLGLLNSPNPAMVAAAALQISDPFYVPRLIELFHTRTEPLVRNCLLHPLGLSRDPAALPILLEALNAPELRPKAINALSNLGDPRAIPYLEPLLNDTSPHPEPDDRGCPLRICDVAGQAIRRLQYLLNEKSKPASAS